MASRVLFCVINHYMRFEGGKLTDLLSSFLPRVKTNLFGGRPDVLAGHSAVGVDRCNKAPEARDNRREVAGRCYWALVHYYKFAACY